MSNKRFSIKEIKEYTLKNKYPLSVHWAITSSCNLRCTHCYMEKNSSYVSLENALQIISFLKKKGFLIVTLSGGECITHPNFKEIYMELKKSGMLINIFTNGTAFNDEIIELLGKYKPNKVEISIYGNDDESFYKTTGVRNGFTLFEKNVKALKQLNINVLIKAPITQKNCNHLNSFIDIAKKNNTEYKFGTFVFPMLNGDKETLKERLQAKDIIDIEFKDETNLNLFKDMVNKKGFNTVKFDNKCSSCLNNFVINSDCSFSYCGMMLEPKFKFSNEYEIEEAYLKVIDYRSIVEEMYNDSPCSTCLKAAYCPGCPAHLMLENGNCTECNKYFNEVIKVKLSKVNKL